MLYLIAHSSNQTGPLPQPEVVATITSNPALTKCMDLRKHLECVAGRLGVTVFEIVEGDPTYMPGTQLPLSLQFPPDRTLRQVHPLPTGGTTRKGESP